MSSIVVHRSGCKQAVTIRKIAEEMSSMQVPKMLSNVKQVLRLRKWMQPLLLIAARTERLEES